MRIHCRGWLQLKNDGVFDVLFVTYDTWPLMIRIAYDVRLGAEDVVGKDRKFRSARSLD
jgi:hypothetical protein